MPGEDDDPDHRQGIEAGGAATAGGPEAGQPHQERRAEHWGLAADEDHVQPRRHRHEAERGTAGQAEEPGDCKQTGGQEGDMEARDREDVDGAGDHERLGQFWLERLARAEEEGGCQRPALRRHMLPQRRSSPIANRLEDRRERRPARRGKPLNRLRPLDPDHRQRTLLPGTGTLVELAGIARSPWPHAPSPHPVALPGSDPRWRAINDEHHPPR